jgi:hypothetical protein
MKLVIDHLTDSTNWVLNAPSTIQEIEEKKFIAGLNDKSLLITFDSIDTVRTAVKTFSTPFDVSEYETLIMSIWSQNYGIDKLYIKPEDFAYKIDIDGIKEFLIPIHSVFTDIQIGIEDVSSITQIKITPLFSGTDSIIISEMIAEKENMQFDVLSSAKETIQYYFDKAFGDGLLIGTVTAAPGDSEIVLNNPDFLNRYGVIKIDDGINSEIHQVEDNDNGTFQLNNNFDGQDIINTFTNANVYLQYPIYINPGQYEIRLPGVSIWGITPEPILRGGKLDIQRDTWEPSGSSKARTEGQIYNYSVLITLESRNHELIDNMAEQIRKFIAGESLWINGRRHDIFFTGPPNELPLNSGGIEYIPQVQYSLDVEVIENINEREALPVTSTININVGE